MKRLGLVMIALTAPLCFSCFNTSVAEPEKESFVRIEDFLDLGITIPEDYERFEKFKKTRFFDSSYNLNYDFNPGAADSDIKLINSSISFNGKTRKGLGEEVLLDKLTQAIYKSSGIELVEEKELYSFGDSSRLHSLITKDGYKVGHIFSAHIGEVDFNLIIVGIIIDEKYMWSDLLDDKLNGIREKK